ncbi:MAG: hypothetical protein NVSMB33_02000 [Ktedonobacteraceae bacterium]
MSEQSVKSLPLQGKRILVTRTQQQASVLCERLAALGATPIAFPTIRIVPPQNWQTLDVALAKLFSADEVDTAGGQSRPYYTWLIFTSANGVNICCERLLSQGYNLQMLKHLRIATIGPATAAALQRFGLNAQLVPDEYIAEGVSAALIKDAQQRGVSLAGQRILLPRAAEARKVLVTALQSVGAVVDEVAAYYTVPVVSNDHRSREILTLLQTNQIDIITFTSSSTVRNFVEWLANCVSHEPDLNKRHFFKESATAQHVATSLVEVRSLLANNSQLKIACIGPITSQTARALGINVHVEAQTFTIDGLVEAIVQSNESEL